MSLLECWGGVGAGLTGDVVALLGELAQLDEQGFTKSFGSFGISALLLPTDQSVSDVTGEDIDADHLAAVQEWLRDQRGELEVVTMAGGQAVYPLLIGVE